MAKYEAELSFGPVYERIEVTITTYDRKLLAYLEDSVRVAYKEYYKPEPE